MPEPLRIGLVVGPTTGGIGRHVETVARELAERGHTVTVCAPPAAAATFDWAATGATVLAAPVGSVAPDRLQSAARDLRSAAADWDVTHAHGMRAGVTAAVAGAHPLVMTWHNGPHDRLRRRWLHPLLERYVCRRAERVLAVSADLADRARRAGAADVRMVAVVAPPLPRPTRNRDEVRAALGIGGRPMVVAVARLEPQKRLDVLVDAVIAWPTQPVPAVVIAGTGSLEDDLRHRIARANAPVTLLGRRSDIADLLAAADVAVLTSGWEGYPLVAQEALRAGTPLIATAVGGVPDLVGEGAALLAPGHPQALRQVLARLLNDPSERERMAVAGQARAAQWPSIEQMVDDLVDNYLDLKSRVRSIEG
jgi:glycosyltransferase involved in cell wall biosynthesis